MNDTLTTEQLDAGYTFRADHTGQDNWSRELYKHPSGRLYVLVGGSLHANMILYARSRDGEPDYPVKVNGEYITRDRIATY